MKSIWHNVISIDLAKCSICRFLLACWLFVSVSQNGANGEEENLSPADGHPRPSYENVADIKAMAEALRTSQPAAQRGAWEWDRLLSRYIDGNRKDEKAVIILLAYFRSILDRDGKGDRYKSFFSGHGAWGSGGRLRIYRELVRQDLLTAQERSQFRRIISRSLAESFDYSNSERSANNRPYGMNGGPAIALRMFPDLPQAAAHHRWLDALWRELVEYGDTTETNYFPYGPIYVDGLLDLAEGMGKFETERDFLFAHANRYLDYVHGGGVRGNPNSGSFASSADSDRAEAYRDPWNAAYFNGSHNDAHVWYRLAKEYQSPEFLWASEQACLGGRPPKGQNVPTEYLRAFKRRYAWFIERNIDPQVPKGGSKVGYYSPLKHKVPERLYLCPSRESGKPFASFYIYDRNNNYMHYNDDVMGQLYEYAVDGAKLLHTSGKYNSNAMKLPVSYDALWVQHASVDFVTGRAGDIPHGTWNTASMPLPGLLNSRQAPDSDRWKYDEEIQLFRRTDDATIGYAHGNMDGYWYLNNEFELASLDFELIDRLVEIGIPRLSGPKGDRPLFANWEQTPESLTVVAKSKSGDTKLVWKGGSAANEHVSFSDSEKGRVLRVVAEEGLTYSVRLDMIDLRFDANSEYTRLLMEHNGRIRSGGGFGTRGGHQAGFRLNGRMEYLTYDARGGILERDSLRAENRGEDSFGQFRFRNYFGPHSRWTRQTVLTKEGFLIVRDEYDPGKNVDGYVAGPCWLLRPDADWQIDEIPDRGPTGHEENRSWFDAPAWDHAWWQKQKKRVLVWIHPSEDSTFGVTAHATTADISRPLGFEYYPTQNFHSKATLKAGTPAVFLSVLVPFDEGGSAEALSSTIVTTVSPRGSCAASIGFVKVMIEPKGKWSVSR